MFTGEVILEPAMAAVIPRALVNSRADTRAIFLSMWILQMLNPRHGRRAQEMGKRLPESAAAATRFRATMKRPWRGQCDGGDDDVPSIASLAASSAVVRGADRHRRGAGTDRRAGAGRSGSRG